MISIDKDLRAATIILLAVVALASCAARDEGGTDDCAESGAYANGVCDPGCSDPDPECSVGGDPCVYPNRYGDGPCDTDCDNPDPDCDGTGTDPCADPNRYGDGPCDLDCWSQDPDCVAPPAGEITLGLPAASPNPFLAGCGASIEFGIQVTATEAVTVNGVAVDVTDIGGTTVALAQQGAGYWTAAFVVPNTVPSGAYDLTITARGTDAQAGGADVTATTSVHVIVEQQAGLVLEPGSSPTLLGGVAADVLLSGRLTVNCATVDAVSVDLSSLGGASAEPLFDDGTHGDDEAGDGNYGTLWTVANTVPNGVYTLPVTATGVVDGTLPVSANASLELRIHGQLFLEDATLLEGSLTWKLGDTIPIYVTERGIDRQVTARVQAWTTHGATLTSVIVDLADLGAASDAPMYDDGPASGGGHEPEGATAGDGTFHATFTVSASQPPSESYVNLRATAADPSGDLDQYRETVVLVHDAGYDVSAETGVPIQSVVGVGTPLSMSSRRGVYGFPDGYEFPFYGVPYGALTFYSSGFVRLGNVLAYTQPYEGDARSYALMGLAPMIAVCQSHDLSVSDYEIWYQEQGVAPNRRFVFEWVATLGFTGTIDAQLILDEATESVTIHYGFMNDTAAASAYPYTWAMLLVNDITEFDEVYSWAEAPPLDRYVMSDRRWIFTPR